MFVPLIRPNCTALNTNPLPYQDYLPMMQTSTSFAP